MNATRAQQVTLIAARVLTVCARNARAIIFGPIAQNMVIIAARVRNSRTARPSMQHHAHRAMAITSLTMNMGYLMNPNHIVDYAPTFSRIARRATRIP